MINVTLTFSSIPEVLEFFTSLGAPATAVKVETTPTPKLEAPAKSKKSAHVPEPEAAPPQVTAPPTAAPVPAAAPEPEPAPTIDYAELQKAVLALYKIDKQKAAQIATDMNYASFKVMPPELWGKALAQVNAALAG